MELALFQILFWRVGTLPETERIVPRRHGECIYIQAHNQIRRKMKIRSAKVIDDCEKQEKIRDQCYSE